MLEEQIAVPAHPQVEVKVAAAARTVTSFSDDVRRGLSAKPKRLAPKYFYDEVGSQLFEQICDLPEYYLTRTERAILACYADEIVEVIDADTVLVELGSGSSSKTRLLIEAFLKRDGKLHYVPVDLSPSILEESAYSLAQDYPGLRVTAHVAEYYTALHTLAEEVWHRKLILFLGSNIGNFDRLEAGQFLTSVRETMDEADRMLIGIDLVKDRQVLVAAYDDAQGVTARFNLNLLARINRELRGHFNLHTFQHRAIFNEAESRMEMYVESAVAQSVEIDGLDAVVEFDRGERIHTENSHKFSMEQINALVTGADFAIEHTWFDQRHWFSLNLLKPL
jgi:dimethylhistidine N-methyltransferase